MATKILFEDSEFVPVSMLLRKSYNGKNIFFSGGCNNLLSKAVKIQNPGDIIIIYYDVAPNNSKTTKGYRNLCSTIKTKNIKDMIVIPIICIEYIVIKCLYKYNQLSIPNRCKDIEKYLIKDLDWNTYVNNNKNNKMLNNYITSSLEHFYKYVLSQIQPQICKLNSHAYLGNKIDLTSGKGKFFYRDCPCEYYCNTKCEDKLQLKAERLYQELPLATIKDNIDKQNIENLLGIKLVKRQLIDVEKERIDFYDKLCINMGVNRIKIKLEI